MRFARMLPAVISFLVLAGCASKNDLNYLTYQIEELNARIPKLEKELGVVKNETRDGLDKSLKGVQTDLEAVRKGSADVQANLESMKVDLQVMAGKVDDTTRAAKKPADDVAFLREDLDRRFAMLEGRLAKLEKSMEDQKKPAETPEEAYQRGLDAFKGGDMQKARELFARFLEVTPTHELAANVHYWLGETYYKEKKFDQAVLEFQEIIKNFPTKDKVPAALLRQAMAFKELGDVKSARYVYGKLVDQYPATDEAKAAKEKLKELK